MVQVERAHMKQGACLVFHSKQHCQKYSLVAATAGYSVLNWKTISSYNMKLTVIFHMKLIVIFHF